MVASNLYAPQTVCLSLADHPTQTNILIDHDCHPRLVDYGFPLQIGATESAVPRCDDLQYLPPELLKPSAFGLKTGIRTKKSDIFAFGTLAYKVGNYFPFSNRRLESLSRCSQGNGPSPELSV